MASKVSFLTLSLFLSSILFLNLYTATSIRRIILIDPASTSNNTEFIISSCNITIYPDLCCTSLSAYANKIQSSPKLLAVVAISVALSSTQTASDLVNQLAKGKIMSHREASAMKDCVEVLEDAVDLLKSSISEINQIDQGASLGSEFQFRINNIQTWVSAALTDQDTCVDGFDENGNAVISTSTLVEVEHLTSNALAFINSYGSSG